MIFTPFLLITLSRLHLCHSMQSFFFEITAVSDFHTAVVLFSSLVFCSYSVLYDKIFSITGHLKEHERTHTKEKPFKCKIVTRASQPTYHRTRPTQERSHSSAKIVTRASQHTYHGTRPTQERSLLNAQSMTRSS